MELVPVNIDLKVYVTDDVLLKILTYLVNYRKEWYAVIFYDKNDNNIDIIDICPTAKGTETFVSFSYDNPILKKKLKDNPLLVTKKIGLIHSHHIMQSTPSRTDWEEIKDFVSKMGECLFLIVNNDLELYVNYSTYSEKKFKVITYDMDDNVIDEKINTEQICNYYESKFLLLEDIIEEFDSIKVTKESFTLPSDKRIVKTIKCDEPDNSHETITSEISNLVEEYKDLFGPDRKEPIPVKELKEFLQDVWEGDESYYIGILMTEDFRIIANTIKIYTEMAKKEYPKAFKNLTPELFINFFKEKINEKRQNTLFDFNTMWY